MMGRENNCIDPQVEETRNRTEQNKTEYYVAPMVLSRTAANRLRSAAAADISSPVCLL